MPAFFLITLPCFSYLLQADFTDLDQGFAYVSFGIVLFVWEFLPTFIVVLFFRVQRPKNVDVVSVPPTFYLLCHLKNIYLALMLRTHA